jgi:hypothetical protein
MQRTTNISVIVLPEVGNQTVTGFVEDGIVDTLFTSE